MACARELTAVEKCAAVLRQLEAGTSGQCKDEDSKKNNTDTCRTVSNSAELSEILGEDQCGRRKFTHHVRPRRYVSDPDVAAVASRETSIKSAPANLKLRASPATDSTPVD
jgi:hypothetical protein